MNDRTTVKDAWVRAVLGVDLTGGSAEPMARLEETRPREAPSQDMMRTLLASIARITPGTDSDLPALLFDMIPRFLLMIQNEPPMDAPKLEPGAELPVSDQALTVANALNAVLRSARQWESLLDTAEQASVEIDRLEQTERGEEQQVRYEDLVASYNDTRVTALAEQARCLELVATLGAEFRAAQSMASQGMASR